MNMAMEKTLSLALVFVPALGMFSFTAITVQGDGCSHAHDTEQLRGENGAACVHVH